MVVDWGSIRNVNPVSRDFGYERGNPIDRYYIERFLGERAGDIRGRVLEIGDDSYTRRFGGARVSKRDILHVHSGNPRATIIGDLACGDNIPSNAFECAIITQTLHLVYDTRAAIRTLHRVLKPGGVLLATVPGVSPVARDEWAKTWFWCFTRHSVQRMFEDCFAGGSIQVNGCGNVLASTGFLLGLATEDLSSADLNASGSGHSTVFTIRAVR